jgi:hypothetical protein
MKQKGVSTALREELKAAIKTRMEAKCGGPCPDRLIELFAEAANTADGNSLDFSISTLLFKNSGVTDISHATGRMAITLDLDGAAYRKLLEIGLAEATSKKLSGASAVAHAKRYALMKLEKFVATLIDDRKVAARRITLIDETGELGLTGTALQKPQPVTAEQLFAPDGVFARTGKKVLKEKQIIGGCEGCSNAEMSVRIIQSNAPSSSGSLLACCNTP